MNSMSCYVDGSMLSVNLMIEMPKMRTSFCVRGEHCKIPPFPDSTMKTTDYQTTALFFCHN